ncbi:MAG: signal recognition particle-docking protein FtsY [Desulfovibrio sp.]|nr:signal recognition particle-docking protein FtsY [Desulfovibrio sp.]
MGAETMAGNNEETFVSSQRPPETDEDVSVRKNAERVPDEVIVPPAASVDQVPEGGGRHVARSEEEQSMVLALRQAEPKLSSWLDIVLAGQEEVSDSLFERISFLLRALEAPADEVERFVNEFRIWITRMEYTYVDEFRSELQYRLALALELEDEEDERSRLFIKITDGLAKTREHLSKKLNALLQAHSRLDEEFWEHLEELFITADLGYEAALALVERLRERAGREGVTDPQEIRRLLRAELDEIFRIPPHITAYTAPEVVLMVGVNGVGKTTTIGKLAHRARLQGRKVMICAADTFRAAAIEQLQVWAERSGALFYAKAQGSDPASVAYEAIDQAIKEGVDLLFVDTAGRLQTKVNLMEELGKIRNVLGKKHPGAPHRTVLVLDATTGQNALSQLKLFKDASGVDELILTKLDGTAKGGFVIALALEHHLPISFIGLGEKLEDLRPFNGKDFALALLEEGERGGREEAGNE